MYVYADTVAISEAAERAGATELGQLLINRQRELSPFVSSDLSELIKVLVLHSDDTLTSIDSELGFPLLDRSCDVAEIHREWFELTLVLSDDGFGVVIYVPRDLAACPRLIEYCQNQAFARS